MSADSNSQAFDENRNVMLYWDDLMLEWGEVEPYPDGIIAVKEKWQSFCPRWNAVLFSKETAWHFLREKFGRDIAELFSTCAVAAMRSDFFRVFWAISEGGIYSDLNFVPIREPFFFEPSKRLTVARRSDNGTIMNRIFFSKKGCEEMKLVANEIIETVSKREIPCILHSTGPGAWTRALSPNGTSGMTVLKWEDLLGNVIERRNYGHTTRGTCQHWKKLQLRMSIYRDPPEVLGGMRRSSKH